MQDKTTDVSAFIADQNAGILEQIISMYLSDVALNVITHHKGGSVTIKFSISQLLESSQINCKTKVSFNKPTDKGEATENYSVATPFHVGRNGLISLFPQEQFNLNLTKNTNGA